MIARAKTSSGPLEPKGSQDGSHPVAYAVVWGIAVGLLLLLVGLLSDTLDTYFNAIGPASLVGGAIVTLFVWRRERQTSLVRPHGPRVHSFESSYEHADPSNLRPKDVWTAESKHLVPFGPYGAGQWTAHPIGLVIVLGLLLMGLLGLPEYRLFFVGSLLSWAAYLVFPFGFATNRTPDQAIRLVMRGKHDGGAQILLEPGS